MLNWAEAAKQQARQDKWFWTVKWDEPDVRNATLELKKSFLMLKRW